MRRLIREVPTTPISRHLRLIADKYEMDDYERADIEFAADLIEMKITYTNAALEAYSLGRLNFAQGMSRNGSPYDGRTVNGRAWKHGWDSMATGHKSKLPNARMGKDGKLVIDPPKKRSVSQKIASRKKPKRKWSKAR